MKGTTTQTVAVEVCIPGKVWREYVGEHDDEELRQEYGPAKCGYNDEYAEHLLRQAIAPYLAAELDFDTDAGELKITEKGGFEVVQGRDEETGQFESKDGE